MNYGYDTPSRDCGFDEPDTTWAFTTVDDKQVYLRKNRRWFNAEEDGEMDFEISYSILLEKKLYLTLPKGTGRGQAMSVAETLLEKDEELTAEREEFEAEELHIRTMRTRGIQW